jgi:hypothetical protein
MSTRGTDIDNGREGLSMRLNLRPETGKETTRSKYRRSKVMETRKPGRRNEGS